MENKTEIAVQAQRTKIKKNIFYRMAKRAMDIVLSLFALVVLSPVFLGTVIAIAIEDGRPFVFKQKRVGKDKKVFNIYKFRSMKKNAAEIHEQMKKDYGVTDISFKLKDSEDPRITKVGRFIRKTNIDELPQLINIIAGQMSIVGPRPYPTYEIEDLEKRSGTKFDERFDVPQGLTCYWQTTFGRRGEISFDERMEMDVQYAHDANLWLDIKLIFKTAIHTLIGKAGY